MSAAEFALPVGAPDEDDVLRDAEPDHWSTRFDEFAMSEGAEKAASLRLAQLRADAGVSVTTLVVPGGTIVWWSTAASADRPAEAGQFMVRTHRIPTETSESPENPPAELCHAMQSTRICSTSKRQVASLRSF